MDIYLEDQQVNKVREVLREGGTVTFKNYQGKTILFKWFLKKNKREVKLLAGGEMKTIKPIRNNFHVGKAFNRKLKENL